MADLLAGWFNHRGDPHGPLDRLHAGPPELTAFLLLARLQEELLFRGAIFELAERAWPRVIRWAPLLLSTRFFSLHHLQLHHYRLTPAAIGQMAFTLPMGWVLGLLRRESKGFWPGLAVHFLTSLPGAFGNP